MQHFIGGQNFSLSLCKQFKASDNYQHTFICKNIMESSYVSNKTSEITSVFPLYLYPSPEESDKGQSDWVKDTPVMPAKAGIQKQEGKLDSCLRRNDNGLKRQPNFDPKILKKFTKGLGLKFIPDHDDDTDHGIYDKGALNPLDILDYIYGVLHSPTYRETYKEFLKIDFPKVPYPTDIKQFWALVHLGREIRLYHLLEHKNLVSQHLNTTYPEDGDNIITTKIGKADWHCDNGITGCIMINDEQYFDNIPVTAWEFYIGGYQPAQKWLKDRKGRALTYEDIIHYQKIIKSLTETDRLMQQIDAVFKI